VVTSPCCGLSVGIRTRTTHEVASAIIFAGLLMGGVLLHPSDELLSSGMTVFQAVEAFRLFTGLQPEAARMLAHMRTILGG